MRWLLHILTLIVALAAIFIISTFYIGYFTAAFTDEAGMAVLAFQIYGGITAALALILGLIGRMMSQKAKGRTAFMSRLGLLTGVCGLFALMGLSFFG
jgi:uncharacterized Tic20 family protein